MTNGIEVSVVDMAALKTPELDAMAQDLIDDVRFVSGKAMAHVADPRRYPLPADRNALERILTEAARETGDATRRDRLISRGSTFAADPSAAFARRRPALDRAIDLTSGTPVFDQIDARLGRQEPRSGGQRVRSGDLPSPAEEPRATLTWRLNHVRCVEETGATSWGSDHLYIGGTTVDPFGNVRSGGVHDLGGGWDSGNALPFDRALAIGDLSLGVGWPRTYHYISAISVRGNDKLYEFLDKLVQRAREYAVSYAATALGGAAGAWVGLKLGASVGSLGGPLGAAAGALVGALVGYLAGAAIAAVWDEISGFFKSETKLFPPITVEVRLPRYGSLAPDGSDTLPSLTLTWSGFGGKYALGLDSRVSWIPGFRPAAIARMVNHLELVATDDDEGLKLRTWSSATGHAWTDWDTVAGFGVSPDSPVTLVAPNPLRLDVLTVGTNGRARSVHREWSLAEPSSWATESLPALSAGLICGSVVGAVSRGVHQVDVFATAKDGHVYTAAKGPQTDGTWAGWWPVGEGRFLPGTPIASVSRGEGRLDLFATGLDGRVWSAAYGPGEDGDWGWSGWFPVLGEIFVPGTPVAAISRRGDQIDLFAVNLNGEVRTAAWSPDANAGEWGGWWRVTETNGSFMPGTPISVVARTEGQLDVFAIGFDGRVWSAAWGPQTQGKWAGWWSIGDATFSRGTVIAATSCGANRIDLFMRGFDGNVWSHAWDGGEWKTFVVR